jgi:hypothetical protein
VFAKEPVGKAPGPHAVRAYLRRLIGRAGIDKEVRALAVPQLSRAVNATTVTRQIEVPQQNLWVNSGSGKAPSV